MRAEHALHVVCGPPAAGKSTHARALARQLGGVLLELDTASEPIVEAALTALGRDPRDRDSPFYKETLREPIYEALFALAAENLPHASVVLVGPFTHELRNPGWPAALEARFGTSVTIHFVTCALEERRRRMEVRGEPRDELKLADWDDHRRYYAGAEAPAFPSHIVDTTRD
ncbi:MAG: AAA family ATPase [Opitutales bacterium]